MRYVLLGVLALALIAVPPPILAARCGTVPGDALAVAAAERSVAGACDCCALGSAAAARRCAIPLMKQAVVEGRISRKCARYVVRDAKRACSLVRNAAEPCRVCNADADCGANEFCECRPGSCDKAAGICTAKPEACTREYDPVCGCDGTTYGNDCDRQAAGVCRLDEGECRAIEGGCFDTIGFACTGDACGPDKPCLAFNVFCTPRCAPPPPTGGECLFLLGPPCTGRPCAGIQDCLPNELCVPECPPPPTTTTLPPDRCASDAECEDGNGCTADVCTDGTCMHQCLCVSPGSDGGVTCCPGPAAECPPPPTSTTTTTLPKTCEPGACLYYRTCGYPVCALSDGPIPGVEPCTTQQEGEPCATWFETCDAGFGCGERLLCTDHDPAVICPISRRAYKDDVSYLGAHDLDRMLAEIRRVRLARYRYKGEPDAGAGHLGFIIDDLGEKSPAVAADGAHVDLYGYTSMAVAAIQAQQNRIEQLEREVMALRRELRRRR